MSPRCRHCEEDTAQHTLETCTAWEAQRRALVLVIGEDLSLAAVVRAMTQEEESWRALTTYCKAVMMAKEEAEREREKRQEKDAPPSTTGAEHQKENATGEREAARASGPIAGPPLREMGMLPP